MLIVYFAFDCLMLNGNDVRVEPLSFRKTMLKRILKKSPQIRYTDHVVGEGEQLFIAVEKLGLEGIIAKKADSPYMGGRTKDWLRIKIRVGLEVMKNVLRLGGADPAIATSSPATPRIKLVREPQAG